MQENSQPTTHLREQPVLLGFAVQKQLPGEGIRISIRWSRILAVLCLLLTTAWISGTGAFYAFLKYRQGFETVIFTDVLFFKKRELKRKMGDRHVRDGMAQIEAGNYREAFRLLHFGVARSPGNLKGRKLIAEFYELWEKRPAIAAEYLLGGLEYGGLEDPEYLKNLIQVLLRNQMDEKIQELADTHLPEEPELTTTSRILALGAASANYQRGNYDRAEDYLINYNLIESAEGLSISSRINWERGNRIAAITQLEQMLNRFPDSGLLLLQLSIYYREMGDLDKARRFAIFRSLKDPLNYKPRLELLHIYHQDKDEERTQIEIERFFEQFSENEVALTEFASFAANTGNVDLAKRIQTVALENDFNRGVFTLLRIEASVVNKDYVAALSLTEDLVEKQSEWLTNKWALFNSLRSVAAFGMNRPDLGEIYLQNFLKDANENARSYVAIANYFLAVGRVPQARKILTVGYQQFPKNQTILSKLFEIELELGNTENLHDLLTELLKLRRPKIELFENAYRKLSSDRFIFIQNRDALLLQLMAILKENNRDISLPEAAI